MAVAFVNKGSATSGASLVTTLSVTYSPTAGNFVVVSLRANGAFGVTVTAADNNSNALTVNTSSNQAIAWGVAVSGATSYTIKWTGGSARKSSIVISEYSGAINNPSGTSSNAGTGDPATISPTSTHVNSFSVAAISTAQNDTFTATSGNLRVQQSGGAGNGNSIVILDNTAVSIGSTITNTVTGTAGTAWVAQAVEIWPTQPYGVANSLMMQGCGV